MEPVAGLFAANMVAVYFIYGLAFFSLGLAVLVQSSQSNPSPFARVMSLLGPFGLLHGAGEWVVMLEIAAEPPAWSAAWFEVASLTLSGASFVILMFFAVRLAAIAGERHIWLPYLPALFATIFLGGAVLLYLLPATRQDWPQALEILAHNWLGLPASLLACWALLVQRRAFLAEGRPRFSTPLLGAAIAFAWYALLDQVIAAPTAYFPGSLINSDVFLRLVGLPVQLFRIIAAVAASGFVITLLRAFQAEWERKYAEAIAARLQAQDEAYAAQLQIGRHTEALNQDLRQATRELSALFETSRILASTLDLQTILRDSVAKIVTLLEPAGLGMIYLWDPAGQRLNLASSSDSDQIPPLARSLGDSMAEQVFETCQPVCCPDVEQAGDDPGSPAHRGKTNVIGAPLLSWGRVAGALVMVSREGAQVFSPGDMPLVQALASQLSIAIDNARLYAEVAEKERLRGQLLDRAVSAQEEERKRIARELHDETGQALSGIILGLSGVESAMIANPTLAKKRLGDLQTFASGALDELRNLVADLRPVLLDDLGLVAALHWSTKRFQDRTGIEVHLAIEGSKRRLDPRVETVLFRVAQEGMTNAAKHAQAKHLSIRLDLGAREAVLSVEDDGLGFDPAQVLDSRQTRPAWGLLGIQERMALVGGTFDLWSKPGSGARVRVCVPLDAQPPAKVESLKEV